MDVLILKQMIDPRVKLFIVFCLSTCGVVFTDVWQLMLIFIIGIVYGILLNVNYIRLYKRLRRILYLFLVIIVIQSIFIKDGTALFKIGQLTLITDIGLQRGMAYLFRVLIIILSGAIISTSNMRDLLQGFYQLHLPYDVAFMVSIGIKFLPLLMEEIQNAFTSIQLRGINIRQLKLSKRIEIISYLFMPTIVSTLVRAQKLAHSVEARGFRVNKKRTSIRQLKYSKKDFWFFGSTIVVFGLVFLKI